MSTVHWLELFCIVGVLLRCSVLLCAVCFVLASVMAMARIGQLLETNNRAL